MSAISEATSLTEVLARYPKVREVLDRCGLQGCGGESGSAESLGFFARVHQIDLKQLLRELNAQAAEAKTAPSEYHETLRDYIYRRFFKAGIAILLTIGGLWRVVNLLQIEFAKSLLLPQLLAAIHSTPTRWFSSLSSVQAHLDLAARAGKSKLLLNAHQDRGSGRG